MRVKRILGARLFRGSVGASTPDGDIAPTGASVELRFADVSQVKDGKIASYHTYYDQLGLMTQLGLMGE
jgi:ketosteroid isomerase-like protein